MKDDKSFKIPFLSDQRYGVNTLVHPKRLPYGMHPVVDNFFPYELGSLSKIKGWNYLSTTSNGPYNESSSSVFPAGEVAFSNYFNSPKFVPLTDYGIKQFLDIERYTNENVDTLVAVIQAEDIRDQIIAWKDSLTLTGTFVQTDNAGLPTYTANFGLFLKSAAGLIRVTGINCGVVVHGPDDIVSFSLNKEVPSFCQYAVVCSISTHDGVISACPHTIIKKGNSASDQSDGDIKWFDCSSDLPDNSEIPIYDEGTTLLDYNAAISKIATQRASGIPSASFVSVSNSIGYFDNDTDGMFMFDKAIYWISPFHGQWVQLFCSSREDLSNFSLFPFIYSGNEFTGDAVTEENRSQDQYNLKQISKHMYLPTTGMTLAADASGFYTGGSDNPANWGYEADGITFRIFAAPTSLGKALLTVCAKDGADAGEVGPPRAKFIEQYKSRLFFAGDPYNKSQFIHSVSGAAQLGFGTDGNKTNIIQAAQDSVSDVSYGYDPEITSLATTSRYGAVTNIDSYLVIGTKSSLFLLYGDYDDAVAPYSGDVQLHRVGNAGVANNRCIIAVPQGLVFLARDNVYLFNASGNHEGIGDPVRNYIEAKCSLSQKYNQLCYSNGVLRVVVSAREWTDDVTNEAYCEFKELWLDLRAGGTPSWWGPHSRVFKASLDEFMPPMKYLSGRFADLEGNERNNAVIMTIGKDIAVESDVVTNLGETVRSELITAEYDFGYPGLIKTFRAIGMTIDAETDSSIYMGVSTDSGDDLGLLEYDRLGGAVFDESKWDEAYWEGKVYGYKRTLMTARQGGRSCRVKILHSDTNQVKITDLELFFNLTRRSYL